MNYWHVHATALFRKGDQRRNKNVEGALEQEIKHEAK